MKVYVMHMKHTKKIYKTLDFFVIKIYNNYMIYICVLKRRGKMKILVCGSRNLTDGLFVFDHLDKWVHEDDILVLGGAKGADYIAQIYAEDNDIRYIIFHPDWEKYGKAAGPVRNQQMLKYICDDKNSMVIAFWNGKSKGTKDMITRAKKAGIRVEVIQYDDDAVTHNEFFEKPKGGLR